MQMGPGDRAELNRTPLHQPEARREETEAHWQVRIAEVEHEMQQAALGQREDKLQMPERNCDQAQPPELPDAALPALLAVFRWLPWKDLLRGPRAVSRRWRQAALDPSLWDNHSVMVTRESFGWSLNSFPWNDHSVKAIRRWTLATLHLVPCLRSLEVELTDDRFMVPALAEALCGTSCGVAALTVRWDHLAMKFRSIFLRIVQRQVVLRRLQQVAFDPIPAEGAAEAITLALLSGVVDLKVSISDVEVVRDFYISDHDFIRDSSDGFRKVSRLESLSYQSLSADPLIEDMVAANADTLQSVAFPGPISSRTLELLCLCPGLRTLDIRSVPEEGGLAPLAAGLSACPLLACLTLPVDRTLLSLLPFFRDAVKITKLHLDRQYDEDAKYVGPVINALASSGRSQLCELRLDSPPRLKNELHTFLEPPPALDFPLLQYIRLSAAPPACLVDAITPSVAPSLRVLDLERVQWDRVECRYPHCCYPALCRLVKRCPQVHVYRIPRNHACGWGRGWMIEEREEYSRAELDRLESYSLLNEWYWPRTKPVQYCSLYGHEGNSKSCDVAVHRPRPRCSEFCFDIEWDICQCDRHVWCFVR